MSHKSTNGDFRQPPRVLSHVPEELTRARLRRLGEGIGKVVYASERWVVKRERSASEILALILVWKVIRKLERYLPGRLGDRLLHKPSHQIRLLRVMMQGLVVFVPKSFWFMTHAVEMWRVYRHRDEKGESLALEHLHGTSLVPERITFPTVRVRVGGWPGWLAVSEAVERVETTLHQRLIDLAGKRRFEEVEKWLDRLIDCRQAGWQRGVFSVDAHLKNFGVTGDRVVLLDPGGLTDDWEEIEERLAYEDSIPEPHLKLGLGKLLESRPDIAERFNTRWKEIVSREGVLHHWPVALDISI